MPKPINQRSLTILRKVIERYVADGQPVGSKVLANDAAIAVSSATIRNVMADLEAQGLLTSPHTSAGRIPTAQGYRLFVDQLLTAEHPETDEFAKLSSQFMSVQHNPNALERASQLLSGITHLVSVVSLPKRPSLILRHIEFLPLSDQRVLVILVLNDHEVQNRVINAKRNFTPQELEQAANYFNHHFVGKDLLQVQGRLKELMQEVQQDLQQMLQVIEQMTDETIAATQRDDYVLSGQENLFDIMDETQFTRLKNLFDVFAQKRDMLHLLDKSLQADGIQIFIGEESGHEVFDNCSVITAPYSKGGSVVGVLGVIGPTRMRYRKVISAVDVTAKLLSQALELDD